jgi:hypothetical protein
MIDAQLADIWWRGLRFELLAGSNELTAQAPLALFTFPSLHHDGPLILSTTTYLHGAQVVQVRTRIDC